MKVKKVLNNSLVLSVDEQGYECILMGKGIGFHLSTGSIIPKSKVEKTYILKNNSLNQKIIQLTENIDVQFFDLSEQIIRYAIEKYHFILSDYLYLALPDHLSFAVERSKNNLNLELLNLLEIQKFNPKEFEVGKYAQQLVFEKMNIELPEEEITTIAMHFVNAQVKNPYSEQNVKVKAIVNSILNIIQHKFKIIYDKESLSYTRAVSHFQLFAIRLIENNMLDNEKNYFLYRHIMESCKLESECADSINTYLQSSFHKQMTNQEKMYLVLHIHRLIESVSKRIN